MLKSAESMRIRPPEMRYTRVKTGARASSQRHGCYIACGAFPVRGRIAAYGWRATPTNFTPQYPLCRYFHTSRLRYMRLLGIETIQ